MLKIFLFKVCLISNSLLCGLIFWVGGWAYACTDVLGRYVFCVRVGTLGYFAANPVGFRFYSVGGLVVGSAPQALIIVSGCNKCIIRKKDKKKYVVV